MADKWNDEAKAMRKHLGNEDEINIEVGCGFRKIRGDVIGIDPIPKGDHANMGKPCVADIVGVASDVGEHFDDGSVSAIVGGHAVHYESDLLSMFQSWYKALKPGGKAAVLDLVPSRWKQIDPEGSNFVWIGQRHGWPIYWLNPEQVKEAAEKAGFKTIEERIVCSGWSFIWAGQK